MKTLDAAAIEFAITYLYPEDCQLWLTAYANGDPEVLEELKQYMETEQ